MNTTSNLHLKKPSGTDPIDISVLNENADTLDEFAGDVNDALAAKQDSISDLSVIRSGAAAGATAVQPAEFEADQQRQDALEAEDRAALIQQVDGGAKNLLNPLYLTAASATGVTITENGDGTYSLSGTATGTAEYLHTPSNATTDMFGLKRGEKYCISTGLSKVKIRVDYSTNGTTWDNSGGSGLVANTQGYGEFTVPSNAVGMYIRFRSNAADGSLDGETLSPMLCTAADYAISPAFVPYAPTNRELYEMILALQSGS